MFLSQTKVKPLASLKKNLLQTFIAGAVASTVFVSSALAIEPTQSIVAPKAERSMLLDLHMAGDSIIAVGERGHILVSKDMGQTWVQTQAPLTQMLTAIDFPSANVGFAVGHDGQIVGTHDGGVTWSLVRDGLKSQLVLNEQAVKNYAAEVSRVQYLIEEGATEDPDQPLAFEGMSLDEELEELEWLLESSKDKLNEDVIAPPLMDVWFKDDLTGYTAGAFGQFFKTSNGGRRWQNLSQAINNIDGYHLNAVVGANDGSVYVAGEAGFLAFSSDGGKSWQRADLGYDGSIFGLIASQDGSTVIATGLRGNTFMSQDKGVTWTTLNTGSDYSFSSGALYGQQSLVLVGAGGYVATSDNAGESFTLKAIPSRSSLSSVLVLPNNKMIMTGQGGIHHLSTNNN